jgi:hypothetical protein
MNLFNWRPKTITLDDQKSVLKGATGAFACRVRFVKGATGAFARWVSFCKSATGAFRLPGSFCKGAFARRVRFVKVRQAPSPAGFVL